LQSFGLFIFGLGVSPLAVTQETLLSHLAPSTRLGLALALGLLLGKFSSFVASLVSLPLANTFGERAPFYAAVLLSAVSFGMNLARLANGWGLLVNEDGAVQEKEEVKKIVKFGAIARLGDVFWIYIV
jgi:MFS family permease